jgi:glutamate--cysteine ligase
MTPPEFPLDIQASIHPAVPHLTTALTGPLLQLERHLLEHQPHIEAWFREQWLETAAPFYASVDLRNAGFKVAPVDTNLFPAGFNNLNPDFIVLCIQAVQSAVERAHPRARRVLLIPERHTRNLPYFESIASLSDILTKAGFEVRVGGLQQTSGEGTSLHLPSGRTLRIEQLQRNGDTLCIEDVSPCLILLNNDLAEGVPSLLQGLAQPVIPPLAMGWWARLKSVHFAHYHDVAQAFATLVDIDPWLVEPLFRNCGEINFMKREGEDCLAYYVDLLLREVQAKYDEYGITRRPFVVMKADAGTYGMGIMSVFSPDEVRELNRKQRTKMAATKGGRAVHKVILQEGVYTFETWGPNGAVAEPVVYLIDHYVVGGFYRVHTKRGPDENLNAPGMHFEPLAFAGYCTTPAPDMAPDAHPNRFYAYGVIARLALLAAAREQAEVNGRGP